MKDDLKSKLDISYEVISPTQPPESLIQPPFTHLARGKPGWAMYPGTQSTVHLSLLSLLLQNVPQEAFGIKSAGGPEVQLDSEIRKWHYMQMVFVRRTRQHGLAVCLNHQAATYTMAYEVHIRQKKQSQSHRVKSFACTAPEEYYMISLDALLTGHVHSISLLTAAAAADDIYEVLQLTCYQKTM